MQKALCAPVTGLGGVAGYHRSVHVLNGGRSAPIGGDLKDIKLIFGDREVFLIPLDADGKIKWFTLEDDCAGVAWLAADVVEQAARQKLSSCRSRSRPQPREDRAGDQAIS